jgi:APA family basic amino acid/polyamine antiporter
MEDQTWLKRTENGLRQTLGLFDATAIGIGAIIGGGIFVVTGIVAGLAGPALVLSIVIATIVAMLTALSLVELTTWLPAEGSVYEYANRLVSPFAGFLAGWMWLVSNTFAGAAVSLGFAYYFTALFPSIPAKLIAAALCLVFTILNYVGARQSAIVNNMLVSAKVVILMIFVGAGLTHINSGNFVPFIPSQVGVLYGAYFIFFAYTGFARVAVVAEEVKDARHTVPRAMMLSLAISSVLYILVGAVAVGLAGASSLGRSSSPLVQAISTVGNPTLIYVISFGGMIATASVLLTAILGVSRVAFAMARRKDLPSALSKLHQTHNTPYVSILIAGGIMALLVLSVDLTAVVAVSTFAQLFYYGSANVSALRLKASARLYPRFLPAVGLGTCILLMVLVSLSAFAVGLVCLIVGTLYYVIKQSSSNTMAPSAF